MTNTMRERINEVERATTGAELSRALDNLLCAEVAALRASRGFDGPHSCPRDRQVIVRGFPVGSDFAVIECCDACRAMFADDDLSEILK